MEDYLDYFREKQRRYRRARKAKIDKEFIEINAKEIMKAKPNYVPTIEDVKEHMDKLYDAEFEDKAIWDIYMSIIRRVDDYMRSQAMSIYNEEWREFEND